MLLELVGGSFMGLCFLVLLQAVWPSKPDPLQDPGDEKNPDGI